MKISAGFRKYLNDKFPFLDHVALGDGSSQGVVKYDDLRAYLIEFEVIRGERMSVLHVSNFEVVEYVFLQFLNVSTKRYTLVIFFSLMSSQLNVAIHYPYIHSCALLVECCSALCYVCIQATNIFL